VADQKLLQVQAAASSTKETLLCGVLRVLARSAVCDVAT